MKRTLANWNRWNALWRLLVGCLSIVCHTISHAADLTRVMFEGEAVPGVAGATMGYPTPLTISGGGKIVGNFGYTEPGSGAARNMVFYASSAGAAIQKLITSGDVAPGGGGAIFTGHWDVFMSDSGQVLVDARFDTTKKALMSGGVGSLSTAIYEGQTRSEVFPGAVVTSIPSFALNRSGQLSYLAYLSGGWQAIWFGAVGSETVALQKDEDGLSGLPAEASFALLEAMVMNDDGDICFSGTIRPDPMIPSIYDGLWKRSGGSISELIREGDAAPGGGTWGQNPRFRSIANSGWSTFTAETSNDQGGLFVASGTSVTRVLRHDSGITDPAPGTGGAAFVIDFNSTTSFQVSSSGRVMLRAGLQSGTGSPAVTFNTNAGIWAGSGGSLNLLVRKGDPIPGFDPGITLYNLFDSGMAADGRIYFAGSGSDFISRLWVDDGNGNFTVVAERGSTVDKLGGDVPIFNVALRSDLGNGADGRATLMTADGKVLTRVSEDGGSYSYGIALTGGLGGGGSGGTISGEIRLDIDGDGDFADIEDTPYDEVVLKLYADDGNGTITPTGPVLDTVYPDPVTGDAQDGYYEFINVTPGTYVVIAELTPNAVANSVVFTAPAGNKRLAVVTAGDTDSGNDFLCFQPAAAITMLASTNDGLEGEELYSTQDHTIVPLTPVRDPDDLALQPRLNSFGGLCADGETPLVIEVFWESPPASTQLRWECTVKQGGSIAGGLYSKMRQLNTQGAPAWVPAATSGDQLVDVRIDGTTGNGTAYVSIFALRPEDLVFNSADPEIELEFRAYNATSGQLLDTAPIRLRRPPVFLIGSNPPEVWGANFLNVLHTTRKPDFIRQLNFLTSTPTYALESDQLYYPVSQVVAGLGWDAEIATLRQTWALTYPDAVGHDTGGHIVLGLTRSGDPSGPGFRNHNNFLRGRFRRGITIGTAHLSGVGLVRSYLIVLQQRIRALGLPHAGLAHIPETILRVPAWSAGFDDIGGRFRMVLEPGNYGSVDSRERLHLIKTTIDASQAAIFPLIGLTAEAREKIMPLGSDGVVDYEPPILFSISSSATTVLPGFIAHSEPTNMFGNAPKQTDSPVVGQKVIDLLDQAESVNDGFGKPDRLAMSPGIARRHFHETARKMLEVVDEHLRTGLATLGPVPAPAPALAESEDVAADPLSSEYIIEIQLAAGLPITGTPNWFAEVFGPNGVTTAGVTATPDSGNPLRVTVSLADGVVGDVVLYASYESGGGIVFANPVRVTSIEPTSATLTSIALDPPSVTVALGDEVRPLVNATYSDGSTLRRWLTAADFTVGSSSGSTVDVSDPLNWKGVGTGSATVTVNYAGLSAQSSVQVVDLKIPRTYSAWRSTQFTPSELADPSISGDFVDRDNDRVGTFFEYLTGGSPYLTEPDQLPSLEEVDVGSGPQRALKVRISKRISGEELDIERSSNLADWTDWLQWAGLPPVVGGAVLNVIEDESFYEIWLDASAAPGGREFYRLGVNNNMPTFTPTGTTEFVFGGFSSTGYGDRVTGTMDGSFVYNGSDAFTPNIEAVFVNSTTPWNTGYGDLQGVIFAGSPQPLRVDLVADFGFAVRLDHFDLAGWSVDRTIGNVEIQDGNGTVLWSQQNVVAPATSHIRLDFTGLNLTSNILTIIIDGTNIPAGTDEVAMDNLQFKQVPTTTLGNWSMLTFESGQGSYVNLDPDYGDRITSATMGSFSYAGAGSFTPGVVVDYLPATSIVHTYDLYGILRDVVYKKDSFATPYEIQLTADAGQEVRLLGFDMSGYGAPNYTLNSVKVLDSASGELFSETNFDLVSERTRIDFSAAPLQSSQITIQVDATNLNGASDNVAIDNIGFEQVAAP